MALGGHRSNTTPGGGNHVLLTPREADLLDFIRTYQREFEGASPTFEVMRQSLGVASKGQVHLSIMRLERAGRIRRGRRGHSRTIRLTDGELDHISTDRLREELERRHAQPAEQRADQVTNGASVDHGEAYAE